MRIIIALLIFITASGCATQKRCQEKWTPIITPIDTVTVVTYQDTIIYKDTTITVTLPADTIRDTVIVEIGMISDPAYIPDSARAERRSSPGPPPARAETNRSIYPFGFRDPAARPISP